jgi:hypothetical protein
MNFIVGGRASGKTVQIMRNVAASNGLLLVVNHTVRHYVMQMAKELNLKIREPMTFQEFYVGKARGLPIKERDVYIDDITTFISWAFPPYTFKECTMDYYDEITEAPPVTRHE